MGLRASFIETQQDQLVGAAENLLTFLHPSIRCWTILYQEQYHSEIVSRLKTFKQIGDAVNIEMLKADSLNELIADKLQGVIQFLVRDQSLFERPPNELATLEPLQQLEPHRWRGCLDVTDQNFDTLFAESQADITAACHAALAKVDKNTRFQVLTGSTIKPCELCIELSPDSAWIICDAQSGNDYQLPAGEIASEPLAADGEVDLAGWPIGTLPFGLKYGRLVTGDCIAKFNDSKVVSLTGKHNEFCRDLNLAFERLPGMQRIVEFGIGTNDGARRAAEHHRLGYLWHEKRSGVHLGLGAELSDFGPTSRRQTAHHVDFVLNNATILASGPR